MAWLTASFTCIWIPRASLKSVEVSCTSLSLARVSLVYVKNVFAIYSLFYKVSERDFYCPPHHTLINTNQVDHDQLP